MWKIVRILAAMLVSGIGRDLLGSTVYQTIRAYHIIPLFLVLAYATTVSLALTSRGGPREGEPVS